ncbi:MAG: hypothetical protein RDV48_18495 [Candidatus Eremiobacteraeota bacterium]|nr:hypothetical protein [Candidatus Eremiobacteraeota bacterium]
MKRILKILCIVLSLAILTGAGCTAKKKELRVGYIDSDKLLVKWEKYREFGDSYLKERSILIDKVAKDPKNISIEIQNKIVSMDTKWEQVKKEIRDELKVASQKVAKEQKFDLVLENSESNPTIEYGGTDITNEVLSILKGK